MRIWRNKNSKFSISRKTILRPMPLPNLTKVAVRQNYGCDRSPIRIFQNIRRRSNAGEIFGISWILYKSRSPKCIGRVFLNSLGAISKIPVSTLDRRKLQHLNHFSKFSNEIYKLKSKNCTKRRKIQLTIRIMSLFYEAL